MKKLPLFLAVISLASASEAQTQPDLNLIARIHFAGAAQISADPNHTAFTNEFCSAEAVALESQTLDKLSRAPFMWAKSFMPTDAVDKAERFRPLLDDLLKSEWIFEAQDETNGSPEFVFAARLTADRAQLWQENLADIVQAWTYLSAEKASDGWRLKKHLPPNLIRFARAGDWIVVSCAQNEFPLGDEMIRRISAEKRPVPAAKNYWLSGAADWPRLAQLFPVLGNFDLPKIDLQVAATNKNLRLSGKLTLAQPLAPLDNWRIPTNTIRSPIASFTAARGFAAWLAKQSWAQPYEISPAPGQCFIWASAQIPLQTFAVLPVPDAGSALTQLNERLAMTFDTNDTSRFMNPLATQMENDRITWKGLFLIAPYVQALHQPTGDFLFGGFFPNAGRPQPLPPELSARLNQSNLVYYHWENTTARLNQLPQLSQLLLMVTLHQQFNANSIAGQWLNHITPTLGSSVTEAKQTAPNELAFARLAPGGLTAIELLALVNWLETANFPGCNLKLPPRKPLNHKPLPQIPGGPPAPNVPPPMK